ncbi:hypothetical protein JCM10213_004739 [Rhodosporidiobolus nylandii]
MSAPPPPPPSPLSISALLASHDNDPHRSLASLVARYNRLAGDYAVLAQEKAAAEKAAQRAAAENQQLWRSLKAMGSSSPRPGAQRQNSDRGGGGSGSGGEERAPQTTTKGLGIEAGAGGSTPSSRSLRRGLSGDSVLNANGSGSRSGGGGDLPPPIPSHAFPSSSSPRHAQGDIFDPTSSSPSLSSHFTPHPHPHPHSHSPSLLRAKAATPPPHASPRQQPFESAASGLRKASSLDLGRGAGAAPVDGGAPPQTPPQPSSHAHAHAQQRRPSSPLVSQPAGGRMSGSSSMPLLAQMGDAGLAQLPSITPVSPLFSSSGNQGQGHGQGMGGMHAFPTSTVGVAAAAEGLASLQLPNGSGGLSTAVGGSTAGGTRRERERSASNNALAPAAAFLDPSSSSSHSQTVNFSALPSSSSSSTSTSLLVGGEATSKADRRRSMFLPLRGGSGSGGFGGAGSAGGMSSAGSTPHSLNLAALAEAPASASAPAGRERRPSRTEAKKDDRRERPTLTPAMLPSTKVRVGSSNIRMNERNKEVISFLITLSVPAPSSSAGPSSSSSDNTAAEWTVEKLYSDVLALDAAVKSKSNRQESRSMASLPDKSLFKDHAPHRGDQRKAVLERYLQTLLTIPLRDRTSICAFFNTDVVPSSSSSLSGGPTIPGAPSASGPGGAMAGWLTKRGRNFGGWQTRFYVLEPGRALCYYESPTGSKIGEIPLDRAAIGRQSSSRTTGDGGDDNAYLHAFLIRTRDDKDQEADHILCAENDDARDAWVQALTTLQPARGAGGGSKVVVANGVTAPAPPTLVPPSPKEGAFAGRAERRRSGSGPPSAGSSAGAGFQGEQDSLGPLSGSTAAGGARGLLSARSAGNDLPPSVSLPTDLNALARGMDSRSQSGGKSSSSSDVGHGHGHGHYPQDSASSVSSASGSGRPNKLQPPPSRRPSVQASSGASSAERSLSPARPGTETPPPHAHAAGRYTASDVSGPMNAVPLPSGYEFKKQERQKKTKSSFWGFASRSSDKSASPLSAAPAPPSRPVFGVPLKEAVAISRIRPGLELPAIVFRCVEYLEAKNAEHEEGIFRLSGSANVIRVLKDRFNAEGDVNLLASTEYYDPHAIAGLLKQYLRELPVHLLTRELHGEFLRVIDLRNRRDRVNALGKLVARLPIEEYTLFRFFFAHLCLIAQNAETSKMGLRNLGIVFSPTLAIPAPLFSLLLAEFDLVFAVEKDTGAAQPIMVEDDPADALDPNSPAGERRAANRNSLLYQASGADKLMEGEMSKLRETDGDDDDTSSIPDDSASISGDNDTGALSAGGEDGPTSSAYLSAGSSAAGASPTLSPSAAPRSPGLPASPRPGGSFAAQQQMQQ